MLRVSRDYHHDLSKMLTVVWSRTWHSTLESWAESGQGGPTQVTFLRYDLANHETYGGQGRYLRSDQTRRGHTPIDFDRLVFAITEIRFGCVLDGRFSGKEAR